MLMTDAQEGNIVRSIQRLDETLRLTSVVVVADDDLLVVGGDNLFDFNFDYQFIFI